MNPAQDPVQDPEKNAAVRKSAVPPIDLSVMKIFASTGDLKRYIDDLNSGASTNRDGYGRYSNDTRSALENEVLKLEAKGVDPSTVSAVVLCDGMRAVDVTITGLLSFCEEPRKHKAIDNPAHIIVSTDCYRQTRDSWKGNWTDYGVQITYITHDEYGDLGKYIKPNTRFVFGESPSNPFLHCLDIELAARSTRAHGIPLIIDSTFASPVNQSPLALGADLVIHSLTKYIAGHNDAMGGAVIGRPDLVGFVRKCQAQKGGVLGPDTAATIYSELQTLKLRVKEQNQIALDLAKFLESQDPSLVRKVWYPLLPSHPNYKDAVRQMRGGGSVVSFELNADEYETFAFLDSLELVEISESFGGVLTVGQPVSLTSYSQYTEEQRQQFGIGPGLIRLSFGIEYSAEEHIADFKAAFEQMQARRKQ